MSNAALFSEQFTSGAFGDTGDADFADLEDDVPAGESPEAAADDDDMPDEEADHAAQQDQQGPSGIRGAQKLMVTLEPVLQQIGDVQAQLPELLDGESIEDNEEYELLKEANECSTQIDSEIPAVHKFIRDHYSERFPFLEELVKNPVQYAKTVAILQNSPLHDLKSTAQKADNIVGVPLKNILNAATLMVVTVEATRAPHSDLPDDELELVVDACMLLLALDKAKGVLTVYVQSRMSVFAPNLTILVGSLTAAHFINYAGGLSGLAKTPACNIPALGTNKATGTGLSTNIGIRHQGFLYHSPLLQSIREDFQKQALRIVSAKVVLAARIDMVHQSPDGSMGQDLKDDCERRLDKLTEVPANKGVRALPAPDDKPSRKRGGRRARKAKEATAMTEIRKAQNRMVFGKEEKTVGYGDSTKGMGMIGATDTGRLRAQQLDARSRAKLSKKNPGWGGETALGGGTATNLRAQGFGGATSMAFTPALGLELVDPKAREALNRKRKADEDRWFKGGSFTHLGSTTPKTDASGFKVPALPNKKQKTEGS